MGLSGRTQKWLAGLVLFAAVLLGVWLWKQNRPDEVFARAISAVEMNDFRGLSAAVARLEEYPNFRLHAHLLRGCALLDTGNAAAALKEVSRTRPEGILRFPVLQYTAQALYNTGRIFEAAQLLTTLVTEDPSSAEAHRWLGAIHYDLGNQSAAIEELTEAARLKPNDHRPHRLLGLICTDESMFGLAVEHYRSALALGKDLPQPDIEADLAILLNKRNRFAEALEVLAASEPTATVWALRADSYDGLGEQDAARDAVQKAIQADPNDARALLLFATQQLNDGSAQNAIEPLQKVLQQEPHDVKARYQLAMAYQKLGQTDAWQREMDARDASTKLHEQFYAGVKQAAADPANVKIREELATIATALGKREVARRWEMAAATCRTAVESSQGETDDVVRE